MGVSDDTSDVSEGGTKSVPESTGGLITSLQPLRIHGSLSKPPRTPTLRECEVIIRQLYNANGLQSQEVSTSYPSKPIPFTNATISAVFVFPLACTHQGSSQGHCVQPENHPRELHYGQSLSR